MEAQACVSAGVRDVDRQGALLVDSTFSVQAFGTLHLVGARRRQAPLAIFVSGDGGWDGTANRFAREVAHRGFTVVGVDIEQLRHQMAAASPGCVDFALLFGRLVAVARARFMLSAVRPVLVGHSAGGSAVFVALAQSPRRVFAGALSLSFAREFEFPVAPCEVAALHFDPSLGADLYALLPPRRRLHGTWSVILGDDDAVVPAADSRAFVDAVPGTHLWRLAGTGHGLDNNIATQHAFDEALRSMSGTLHR